MERYDARFLLSVKELACENEDSPLWKRVYEKLDGQRIAKVNDIRVPGKRATSAGAGLLLQYWLRQWADCTYVKWRCSIGDGCPKPKLQLLTLDEVLDGIKNPWENPVKYKKNEKPYPDSCCFCFNLSHSEEYVVAAFSERELGIDIQSCKKGNYTKLIDRFFTEEEKSFLDKVGSEDEALFREWFYRLWTRKEAYGKLIGEGIAPVIGNNFLDLEAEWLRRYEFEEYDFLDGYQVTCCAWKRQEENQF